MRVHLEKFWAIFVGWSVANLWLFSWIPVIGVMSILFSVLYLSPLVVATFLK